MAFFSSIEIRDIVISLLVLSVVFSFRYIQTDPAFILVSLLTVGLAFMGHELAHKFTAIRQGFWSEYRMWPRGLLMAFLLAIATGGRLIFAAPGAVYFTGTRFKRPNRKELRNISMAGVIFNIVLMWISISLFFISGSFVFHYMAIINGWLAIFNLLPFGMLDGSKLFRLDRKTWSVLFVLGIAGFVLSQVLIF